MTVVLTHLLKLLSFFPLIRVVIINIFVKPHRQSYRGAGRATEAISGFAFVDIGAFRRSKSIKKTNFVDINGRHQFMAKI